MPSVRQLYNYTTARAIVRLKSLPPAFYTGMLVRRQYFSFARFGDGEWAALLGDAGENCDGHRYFPQLGIELESAVANRLPYIYAIQRSAMRSMGRRIGPYLARLGGRQVWHNADVFHDANRGGRLGPFIRALRDKKVVLIGPAYLREIESILFRFYAFIEIPPKDCFLEAHRIERDIRALSYRAPRDTVYAFSSSMTTNILIHRLFPLLGDTNWLLDLGSLWDGYVARPTRSYFRSLQWENARDANMQAAA